MARLLSAYAAAPLVNKQRTLIEGELRRRRGGVQVRSGVHAGSPSGVGGMPKRQWE
jgi:hypothetical protein